MEVKYEPFMIFEDSNMTEISVRAVTCHILYSHRKLKIKTFNHATNGLSGFRTIATGTCTLLYSEVSLVQIDYILQIDNPGWFPSSVDASDLGGILLTDSLVMLQACVRLESAWQHKNLSGNQ